MVTAASSMGVGVSMVLALYVVSMVARRFGETTDRTQFVSWLLIGVAFGWQALVGVLLLLTVIADRC